MKKIIKLSVLLFFVVFAPLSVKIDRVGFIKSSLYQTKLSICKTINIDHKDNFLSLDDNIFCIMLNQCDLYKIPYSIFFSKVDQESGFLNVKNSQGSNADSYMQLMPGTYYLYSHQLGLSGCETPENNIKVGAYYIYSSHNYWRKSYRGDDISSWRWTLAEYECGRGGLQILDDSGKVVGYKIPDSVVPRINHVINNYVKSKIKVNDKKRRYIKGIDSVKSKT